MNSTSILSRLTRDISDGLIVLNLHGEVILANKCIREFLGNSNISVGASYAEIMMSDGNEKNDAFHQFLLDAVYDKDHVHTGKLSYYLDNGTKKIFRVTSSYLFDDDGTTREGVVIQIADITDVATLREKVDDSAKVFVVLMSAVCVWVIIYAIWEALDRPVSGGALTKVVEIFCIGCFLYLLKFTSITINDMGLGTRGIGKALLFDGIMTVVCLAILIVIKLVMIRNGIFDAQQPFILLDNLDWSFWIYPITAVVQEFLTRGVTQESIQRIIPGKYSVVVSIFTSSLFITALHIHKGFVFMVGAFCLQVIFGILYSRQKTIWGLCIPHLVLGWSATLLFSL